MSERGLRFWFARLVAPIAFFAAATLLVLLVRDSFADEASGTTTAALVVTNQDGEIVRVTTTFDEEPATAEPDAVAADVTEAEPAEGERPGPRFHRVKTGDTLEGIAAQRGITVAVLRQLNPRIDAVALTVGQRVRLRE